jgi:hypothetical protein
MTNASRVVVTKKRLGALVLSALTCVCCPLAIAGLGCSYGFDRLPSDDAFRVWPLYAVDACFWADLIFTTLLIWLVPKWRLLAALIAVPLLCLTAMLAVTNGMWIDGSYL